MGAAAVAAPAAARLKASIAVAARRAAPASAAAQAERALAAAPEALVAALAEEGAEDAEGVAEAAAGEKSVKWHKVGRSVE